MLYLWVAVIYVQLEREVEYPVLIPFKTEEACGRAMGEIVVELREEYPEAWGTCRVTDIAYGVSLRPEARP